MFSSSHPGSTLLWVAGLSVPSPTCGRLFQPLSTISPNYHRTFSSSLAPRHSQSLSLYFPGEWNCRIITLIYTIQYISLNIEYTLYCTCILHGPSPSILCFIMYNHGFFLPDSVVMCYFAALASVYGKSVALLRAQLKLVSCQPLPFWFKVKHWFITWMNFDKL